MQHSNTKDTLLRALLRIGEGLSHEIDPDQAVNGLPLQDGRLTPDLFETACQRAGLEAKVSPRPVAKIHPATLPAVLPLKNGAVFVLERKVDDKTVEGAFCHPEKENSLVTIPVKLLKKQSTGVVFLIKRDSALEQRACFDAEPVAKGHWFWGTLWKFRSVYWRVGIATLCINMMALASSIFIMNVYDRVVPNEATDTLMALAIGVLIAYLMEFGLKSIRTAIIDRAGRRIDVILGGEVFSKVLATSFLKKPASAGTLASQARSYETLREFFTSATVVAMVDLPFAVLFVGVVYLLGGITAAPLAIGIVLALLVSFLIQFPMKGAVNTGYQASNQRYALMVESVNALETVKTTGSESHLQSRMEDCVRQSATAEGRSRSFSQLGANSLALIAHLVSTFTVVVAYFEVTNRNMSMGAMIACVILAGRAMQPLNIVASLLMRLQQSLRSLRGLNEMMEASDERDRKERIALHQFQSSIQIDNLKFGFGENPEETLKGVNLKIRPGERVALLGRIGCGKTTLMRLLMALYDPREGSARISGLDTRQWSAPALRKHIGYLPQDASLLYGTLRSNLVAGCEGQVTDDDILNVLKFAGLEDFVASLPDGLATPVSEGGKSLSGGQRQSLFLARALMRSPEILLLDEPTSSMDISTEKKILSNLVNYCDEDPNRTLLVATHRRSVLSIVDRVIVLHQGAVISDGPKEKVIPPAGGRGNKPRGGRHGSDVSESGDVALAN